MARTHRVSRIILRVVLIVVIALIVLCVGGFSCYRWLYGNDTADIRGTWYVAGTDTPVTITQDEIVLNDQVSYAYTLDTETKTVVYTLGTLQGDGHYRFSFDRTQLAIMDGTYTWWDTLISDFGWTAQALVALVQGKEITPADVSTSAEQDTGTNTDTDAADPADNVTLLSRTPTASDTSSAVTGTLGAGIISVPGLSALNDDDEDDESTYYGDTVDDYNYDSPSLYDGDYGDYDDDDYDYDADYDDDYDYDYDDDYDDYDDRRYNDYD